MTGLLLACLLAFLTSPAVALGSPTRIAQYAHTSWTIRDGYSLGLVFAIAQTHDGYLWLGGSNGLFRFDGLRFTPWQPPGGEQLPSRPYSLLVSRDGTLWIGTFDGLVSWDGARLTRYPPLSHGFVTSLLEDRDGSIWAGVRDEPGRLCAIRGGQVQCFLQEGRFGSFVWSLVQDGAGTLWVGADSGLWRWKPGPPQRFKTPGPLADLATTAQGQVLAGILGAGLGQLSEGRLVPYAVRKASDPAQVVPDRDLRSNKILRARDGAVWIGTKGLGIVRVQDAEADMFSKAQGLSGDIACSLFEDAEGNIWYASERGLDRFRKLPFTVLSAQQGVTNAVLATPDGSVWVATDDGVTQWKDGRTPRVFGKGEGLPDARVTSLYQDAQGVIWAATNQGLAYRASGRFRPVQGLLGEPFFGMTGDAGGHLWVRNAEALVRVRLRDAQVEERLPWASVSPWQQAKTVLAQGGGLWMGFWKPGGVMYFKDGQAKAVYNASNGLGDGNVSGLMVASDGAVWAATSQGGLSRIKDGRVASLTVRNGLPCNRIHWSAQDDSGSIWMYTSCGLVRVMRDDLDKWIADPRHRVSARSWGTAEGVMAMDVESGISPPVAKAPDGTLWFVSGDGVQRIDPQHVLFNAIPPPVHIEQLVADRKSYPVEDGTRLPPLVRDITIGFTALSLVDPRGTPFRYRLEGHDTEWQEALDRRQATYTNLPPGDYRFQVMAANNNGVWNEKGAQLRFSIMPALYQTTAFRIAAGALLLGLAGAGFQLRLRQLTLERQRLRQVINGIPAMAFAVNSDGSQDMVNQRWIDFAGPSLEGDGAASSWESTLHPDDAQEHSRKWTAALATGAAFENESRHLNRSGEYRWLLVQAVPLRDRHGKIVKWYGTLTDIEERKQAEQEAERLRRLEAQLVHTNRLSMLGELTASLAHEINQPISAVMVNAGAGLRWLERDEPELQQVREAIKRIKDDGKRAADIITGLKKFYRKDGAAPRALVDVNDVVREMLVLLQQEARQHAVSVRTDLAPGRLMVRADRVQMQQVLMNLMVNGMEAMAGSGGELGVTTRRVDGRVQVSVADQGVGIEADKLETIFSAFVTTKPTGTGMGLAISRTLVEAHDGRLWAESNPAVGATFHFTIPEIRDGAGENPCAAEARSDDAA